MGLFLSGDSKLLASSRGRFDAVHCVRHEPRLIPLDRC
jgi:hypothetical protein